MTESVNRAQARSLPVSVGIVVGARTLLVTVIGLTAALANPAGEMLTRNTVRLSLAWYALALCLMMRLAPSDWLCTSTAGRLVRWCWTWAAACFLVHLAFAFHVYHHWSHADAFEHTRQISGSGEGIYASYLFTWLWVTDVAWWSLDPARYAARSPWIDRALHAFMLFIVFNGMVVFERGAIRWAGLLMFIALPAAWFLSRSVAKVRLT